MDPGHLRWRLRFITSLSIFCGRYWGIVLRGESWSGGRPVWALPDSWSWFSSQRILQSSDGLSMRANITNCSSQQIEKGKQRIIYNLHINFVTLEGQIWVLTATQRRYCCPSTGRIASAEVSSTVWPSSSSTLSSLGSSLSMKHIRLFFYLSG